MFIEDKEYQITFTDYSVKHFCKDFSKRYGKKWEITKKSIEEVLKRLFGLSQTSKIDLIKSNNGYSLLKFDFRIAGTKMSAKSSGNRMILFVDNETATLKILLVYHKGHFNGNETVWWKEHMKSNYPDLLSKIDSAL